MQTIAVIDYGMSNLRSVTKALEHVADGDRVIVSDRAEAILAADRVLFPGQGAARDCMHELRHHELPEVVREAAASKPFLGICMGMQVLLDHSEEGGGTDLLGIIPGTVRRFAAGMTDPDHGERLKIPQMGWNQVHQETTHPLWRGIAAESRFYFVHSYYVEPTDPSVVTGSTVYGQRYCSVLAHDNLFAAQFHPEKSQHAGIALLANFVRWDGQS
ncbi:imidazole glycerol phosphate synthase subunit HisH [Endothiovibrio diazotrophicus]